MVSKMTNRLLAVVIAVAFSSGIAAHAAQSPQQPIAPIALTSASSLPTALQTAAAHIGETATGTFDPSAAIRDAYQRDHVALERLRQQASALKGSAHPAFNQYIDEQESSLDKTEHSALATIRPAAPTAIAAMDQLVSAAQQQLGRLLAASSKPGHPSTGSSGSHGNNRSSEHD